MKRGRTFRAAAAASFSIAAVLTLAGCEREARRFTTPANNETRGESAQRTGSLQPGQPLTGGVKEAKADVSPYEENAFAVNQGKRLFRWYNCSGCHSNGGGGIGPALMDSQWKYGSEPANIFASITQGRPQGMPSFGGHIPDDQVWQIVAYVRSMSGQLRKDVAPSRGDTLSPGQPENARPRLAPQPDTSPQPKPPGAPS
jgi:cytochrome c oxidase cbb3-type subunit 3